MIYGRVRFTRRSNPNKLRVQLGIKGFAVYFTDQVVRQLPKGLDTVFSTIETKRGVVYISFWTEGDPGRWKHIYHIGHENEDTQVVSFGRKGKTDGPVVEAIEQHTGTRFGLSDVDNDGYKITEHGMLIFLDKVQYKETLQEGRLGVPNRQVRKIKSSRPRPQAYRPNSMVWPSYK